MSLQPYKPLIPGKRRRNIWFERLMAIVATANLSLVLFDLTYVPWRNFWLQGNLVLPIIGQKIHLPIPVVSCPDRSVEQGKPARFIQQSVIVCLYDPVKGIEPHRETEEYINTVALLEQQITQQGAAAALRSPQGQETLAKLRRISAEMISSNPFAPVNKSGTLEKIKNRMRQHVGDRVDGALANREAFEIFWSTTSDRYPNYLSAATWSQEIAWFNTTLRPLLQTNYYRTTGENGEPTNYFWILDAPFIALFLLEFLARTFYISSRYKSLTWLDAMIWRWYDIPLFIPFSLFEPLLALTRILPTALRLHQAKIIDLHIIYDRARQGFVAAIAEEITEVVIVQVVNQVQAFVQRGELTKLLQRTTSRRYVDINNINEVEVISKHFIELLIYQVFPKVQPDLEALLRHSISSTLNQSPAYRGLIAIPGIGSVPEQLTDRLVSDIVQTAYTSLKAGIADPKTTELTTRLLQNFTNTIATEAQQHQNLAEIQALLFDLLEEVKINYIQRLSEEDATLILDETRQLKQQSQQRRRDKK